MAFQESKKSRDAAATGAGGALGSLTAFIDQGSEFSGKLSFKDTVRIDGKLEGEISSDNTLIVGETGEIRADIHSEFVVVSGVVEGDIVAARQILLHKSARVSGNIQTPSLVMEEGAQVNGQVSMGAVSDQMKASPPRSTSRFEAGKTPEAG